MERDEGVGSAIHIEAGASLTLRDSVGTGLVTGGNHDNGGGILNRGTLIMEGGCISGNTALHTGGGLAKIGTMVLMGGGMRGNTALVQRGGFFNQARARLTVDEGVVFENSAPRDGDIANAGTLTVIDAGNGQARIEEMPVIRRFMARISVIPTAVLLFGNLFYLTVRRFRPRTRRESWAPSRRCATATPGRPNRRWPGFRNTCAGI